jgi:hypothetical protein
MECKDYQDLLIQLPFEELSPEEKALLENHLKSCDKCTAKLESNQQLFGLIKKLKTSIPEDNKKETNINSILKKINIPQKIWHQSNMRYRTLRIITNAAAVFLIGLFLFQQMEIKRNLKDLNERVVLQNFYDNNTNDIEITSFLNDPKLMEKLDVSENEVLELIDGYRSIQEERSAILNYLQINHPEVYKELQKIIEEDKYPIRKL